MDDYAAPFDAGLVGTAGELERQFEARVDETATLAFRVAFSVLRHRQDAEDVAQDACARAFQRLGTLRNPDRLRAWLVRVTWRLALDHRRAEGRRQSRELAAEEPPGPPSSAELLIARERAAALWRGIDALPDRLRLVLILAAIEEHDVAEVATLLDLPVGTVKSRLFAARQKLKEYLRCLDKPSR